MPDSVLEGLLAEHQAAQQELDELLRKMDSQDGEPRQLTDEEEKRSAELAARLKKLDEKLAAEVDRERRSRQLAEARKLAGLDAHDTAGQIARAGGVHVSHEPRTYGPDSPHSHFADLAWASAGPAMSPRRDEAIDRLNRWAHEVERELALGTREGMIAERKLFEVYREGAQKPRDKVNEHRDRGRVSLEEKRAIATGGGATASASGGGGAAFVSPVFFLADYAPYREYGRAFADQCAKQGLPDYGMDVYVPAVTGPAQVARTVDGAAVPETDPSFGYLSAQLQLLDGQVAVTQMLLDRAGPNFAFDRMIFDQLRRDYAPKLDGLVLAAALTTAGSVPYSGTFTVVATSGTTGSFYSKVSQAKVAIRTTAGTVLNPTHLFVQPNRWEYIAAWGDASGRPIVVPSYAQPFNAAAAGNPTGDAGIEGDTGYRFNGLRAFTDPNIPAPSTGADQAIVADMSEVWLFEGEPFTRAVPQTLAGNLLVLLQLISYATALVRYPLAVQAISGTAMAALTF